MKRDPQAPRCLCRARWSADLMSTSARRKPNGSCSVGLRALTAQIFTTALVSGRIHVVTDGPLSSATFTGIETIGEND